MTLLKECGRVIQGFFSKMNTIVVYTIWDFLCLVRYLPFPFVCLAPILQLSPITRTFSLHAFSHWFPPRMYRFLRLLRCLLDRRPELPCIFYVLIFTHIFFSDIVLSIFALCMLVFCALLFLLLLR